MALWKWLERWFEPLCIVTALSLIIILVFTNVILRLFDTTLPWAGELARYLFVWMIYLGISYAIRERRHLCVTLIHRWLPRHISLGIDMLADIIFLVYSVMVAYYGYLIMLDALRMGQITPALEVSVSVLYAAIVVGGILGAAGLTARLSKTWSTLRTKRAPS